MDIFNMGGKGKKKGKKKSKRAAPLPAASTVKKTKTSHKVVAGGKTHRGLKAGGGKQDVVGGGKAEEQRGGQGEMVDKALYDQLQTSLQEQQLLLAALQKEIETLHAEKAAKSLAELNSSSSSSSSSSSNSSSSSSSSNSSSSTTNKPKSSTSSSSNPAPAAGGGSSGDHGLGVSSNDPVMQYVDKVGKEAHQAHQGSLLFICMLIVACYSPCS